MKMQKGSSTLKALSTVMLLLQGDPDPFGEIWTHYRRFGLELVMDPMHWRFENRPMGWSVDQYRFVQWRPEGDSVTKLRHFMWVFAFVLFS